MSRAPVKASSEGVLFVAAWEGVRVHPYNDAAGNATIGVGHLLHPGPVRPADVAQWDGFTQAEAIELLRRDIASAEFVLRTTVHPRLTSQFHVDALCSFVFNVGATAFLDSTLRARLNAGDRGVDAADELLRWTRAGGRQLPGLVRRRVAERALYLHGRYERP